MAHPLITATKVPDSDVIAAYNCIEFCYEVTDNITVVGTESFLDLQVDAAIPSGQTMTIFGQQFLFTAAVNDDGHKIALGVDEFEQRDFIYDTLLTNYEISRDFNFAKVSTDRISFTAKKKGIDYNINFSSTTGDLQVITDTDGVDSETREAYKVIGSIQIRKNGEWVLFDEEVRDVVLKLDSLGNFKSEVCFKLHGILRSYFKNAKPDLQANHAYINEWAVYEFRFGIVDFKATIGEVSTSGFFDRGTEIYCVLNGMHKVESQLKLKPYYENENKGVYFSLNQIPQTNTLCTDNNTFLSVFVRDKNLYGWGVQVVGDIYFEDGTTIYNHVFSGYTGVGSSVVVLPIGPRNIEVCNDAIWSNQSGIKRYTYRAFVYSNVESANLFVDGDDGTFEADILGITSPVELVKTQTSDGYVGNAIKLDEFQDLVPINPNGQLIIQGNTAIAFVQGNVYFLEAWIKVKGLDCRCFENLFKSAAYGTFESNIFEISVISGATSSLISGYENQSLMIKDFQASALTLDSFIMYGLYPINFLANEVFEITAWVKVTVINNCEDCLQLDNLFEDGNDGTFEGSIGGIEALLNIAISLGTGNGSADALNLAIGDAAISSGVVLFYGDSGIQFFAGRTYKIKMQVNIGDFNCDLFGNLFVDGYYGDFETGTPPWLDIATLAGITQSSIIGYPATGIALKLQDIEDAALSVGSILMYGNTGINFQKDTTYLVSMQVKASIDPQLFENMFVEESNGTFESGLPFLDIVSLAGITQDEGLGHPASGVSLILRTLDSATIVDGSILFYGDSNKDFVAGLTYILSMFVKVSDDIDCSFLGQLFLDGDNGTFEANITDVLSQVPEYLLSQSVGYGYVGNSLIIENLVPATVSTGDFLAYGDTDMNFLAGETYRISAWIDLEGAGLVAASADATGVKFIMALRGSLSIGDINVISTTDITYNSSTVGTIGGIFSEIVMVVQFNVNKTLGVGVRINTGAALIAPAGQEIYLDEFYVKNTSTPATINLEASLETPIGANGTEVVDFSLQIDDTCSQLETWTYLQTTITVTTSFTGKVGLKTTGVVGYLQQPDVLVFVDNVQLLVDVPIALVLQASLETPIGTNGTQTVDLHHSISSNAENDVWQELITTLEVTDDFTGNIGLRAIGLVPLLKTGYIQIAIDKITVTIPGITPIQFQATLQTPIGANGFESIDQQLVLESSCAQNGVWVDIETTLQVINSFVGKVGLIVLGDSAYLIANTADVVDVRVDNITVYDITGTQLELRLSTTSTPFGVFQYQQTLKIGQDCPMNEWVQLKTILTKSASTENLNVGLQIVNAFECFMNEFVEVVIDNIKVKSLSQSGVKFEIITTEGANVMQYFEVNDCEELDEWRKITSIYIPTASSSENVRIIAKNMQIGCLTNNDVEVIIDEIKVRGYNDAHASMTQEQIVILKDDCDCQDDCCNEEFAYRNELGQFDFIHMECIYQETTNVDMTNAETCKDCDDDIADFGSKTINAKSKNVFVINARITKERREQFKIFISSIEKYHVVDNRYYPIEVLTKELPTFKKASNYVDVDIEFQYRFENPTLIS